jgi:hypothetical protein
MEATQDEEQSASGAINRTQIVQLTAQCGSKWFIMALHEDSGLERHDRSTVKYKKVIHPLFYMARIQQSLQCLQSLNALRVLTRGVQEMGIPVGPRGPMGFPWEWE